MYVAAYTSQYTNNRQSQLKVLKIKSNFYKTLDYKLVQYYPCHKRKEEINPFMYMTLTSVVHVYMLILCYLSSAKTRIFMLPYVLLLLVIAHNYFNIFIVFYSPQFII